MEINNKPNKLHPLVAAAAIAVLLASLVGVAAMTGMLPSSNSTPSAELARQAELKAADEKAAAAEKEAKEAADRAAKLRKDEERRIASSKAIERDNDRPARAAAICYDCGRVESVRTVQTAGQPTGVGIVGGAVVGGLLGNQIGGGSGRSLATVAGAVGGGYAGNEIEKHSRTRMTHEVRVRMEGGQIRTFPYNNTPPFQSGDRVRVVDGYLRAR